ncbi:MAG TPA: zf-HC2 domain-containing protein [Thermoanaerobaculia bacterium]|nr:zf-HC2 domain-containing protein [Thermoanaerobaculia bacterium]
MNGIEHDSTLRNAFQARTGGPPPGTACPEPGRIYDAARGALPPGETREVVEHLAVCPDCAEAWRLAAAFEEEAAAGTEPVSSRARSPRYLRPVAAAAALVLAALAAGLWWTVVTVPEEAPVYRAGAELEIRSLLPEGEPLPRDAAVLRWALGGDGSPEGTTYDLLVSGEDLQPLAEADELEEPSYRVPPAALEALPSGAEILWRVEAHLPDGRTARSPTFTNRIK